jgi:hypothetical protein
MVYEFTRCAGGGVRAKMPYRGNGSEWSHKGERDTEHHRQDAKSHRRSLGVVIQWAASAGRHVAERCSDLTEHPGAIRKA